MFIARAQRRVTSEEVIRRAQEQLAEMVEEAQQSLLSLRGGRESTASRGARGGGIAENRSKNWSENATSLRQAFRKGVPKDGQGELFDNIPDLTAVPPMPSDRQDLEG